MCSLSVCSVCVLSVLSVCLCVLCMLSVCLCVLCMLSVCLVPGDRVRTAGNMALLPTMAILPTNHGHLTNQLWVYSSNLFVGVLNQPPGFPTGHIFLDYPLVIQHGGFPK